MNKVDTDRIKAFIKQGTAEVIDYHYCEAFDNYQCEAYPWLGFSDKIDWEAVKKPYKRFSWQEATVEETTTFLKTTCLGRFKEVCIVYGAKQPGLVLGFADACENLEQLVAFGWATRCIVGVERDKYGLIKLNHECFVEVDFVDWLTAPG